MNEKYNINAILDSDLIKLLSDLNLLEKVNQGELRCRICGTPVTVTDIAIIHIVDGNLEICCNSEGCFTNNQSL